MLADNTICQPQNALIDQKPRETECQRILQLGLSQSGVYRVHVRNMSRFVDVYCDQSTDGGGWTVRLVFVYGFLYVILFIISS